MATKRAPASLGDGQGYELVPIDSLVEHPENPRRSDDRLIEAMIRRHGWYGTVVAQRSTGYVLAGNGRLRAARRVGMTHLPTTWKDIDDDEAREILAGDNRASDMGGYDDEALLALLTILAEGPGLDGAGYDDHDLALLVANMDGPAAQTPTPTETSSEFDGADIRTVTLPYQADRYVTVVNQLQVLRRQLDLEAFADVVAVLCAQATADIAVEP